MIGVGCLLVTPPNPLLSQEGELREGTRPSPTDYWLLATVLRISGGRDDPTTLVGQRIPYTSLY